MNSIHIIVNVIPLLFLIVIGYYCVKWIESLYEVFEYET